MGQLATEDGGRGKQAGEEIFHLIPVKFTHQKSDLVKKFINLTWFYIIYIMLTVLVASFVTGFGDEGIRVWENTFKEKVVGNKS